jgi:hypothetical protein
MQAEIEGRKMINRNSESMTTNTWVAGHLHSTLTFVENLVGDMGLKTRRKRNIFSEWFLPYTNEHWEALITHHV